MATSILERKKDLVYLIFFLIHIPVMLGELDASPYLQYIASLILSYLLFSIILLHKHTAIPNSAAKLFHFLEPIFAGQYPYIIRISYKINPVHQLGISPSKFHYHILIDRPHRSSTTNQATAFDLTAYYPAVIKPAWMAQVRDWYVSTYGDRFFFNPP